MVTITDYKTFTSEKGETFHSLVVQGGIEMVRSKQTKKMYLTAKTTSITCTFNESMCKSLIGKEIPGSIIKKEVSEYDYTVPETGEVISLSHTYEFVDDDSATIHNNVIPKTVVL